MALLICSVLSRKSFFDSNLSRITKKQSNILSLVAKELLQKTSSTTQVLK